ncbi:metallopeptidase, partial [mine drainage metagenome]
MPESYNYGAIGAVIGHEMTHGFDDQGRKYDAGGNLVDWWLPDDEKRFGERIEVLRTQLCKARFKEDLTLNPELLMGEFIADIGGVNLAYEAMLRAGIEPDQISEHGGLTHRQLFFLAFAHLWAGDVRDDTLRLMLASDPHPPATVRVNETLRNVPAFADA